MHPIEAIEENSRSKGFLDFIVPYYDGLSIINILPTVLNHLGYKCSLRGLDFNFIDRTYFENIERVLLIIVDSLNYSLALKNLELLKYNSYETLLVPITSVAPTTTSTALTSIYTGVAPQEHGVLGYRLYIRELGMVINTIEFAPIVGGFNDSLRKCGVKTEILTKVKPLPRVFAEEGLRTSAIGYKKLEDTAFTSIITDGCEMKTYISLSDMLANCRKALEEDFQLVIAYWGLLDSVGHEYGPNSYEFNLELKHVLLSIRELLIKEFTRGSRDCLVILTADHGQIQVSENSTIILGSDSKFLQSLAIPPYGESRFLYLQVYDEERLLNAYTEEFSDKGMLFRTEDLVKRGVFGEGIISNDIRFRLGDFIMIMKDRFCVIYPYSSEESVKLLKGRHGGLSYEESIVPLILIRARSNSSS